MDFRNLRSMIPGMLPLAVLIIAEMIWGITVGLIVAAILGVVELCWNAIRYKRFEKSLLPELGLLILFCILAVFLEEAVLDKLMTVFILALLLMMTGVSAFSKHNLLMASAGRYFKNITVGIWEMYQIRQTMIYLFWFLASYILLFVFCFFLLPEFTDFMGSNGLFLFFGIFMITEFLRKRYLQTKLASQEWLPLVNEDGKVLSHAPRSIVHNSSTRWLHPVVHLQVVSLQGIWLQKRSMHKLVQPGKWDTAVGGHLSAGESVELSLAREAAEEIGLEIKNPKLLGRYIWESDIEREIVFAFVQWHNGPFSPNPEELDGGRFWSFIEVDENIGKDVFTPNFEYEYKLYASLLRLALANDPKALKVI